MIDKNDRILHIDKIYLTQYNMVKDKNEEMIICLRNMNS